MTSTFRRPAGALLFTLLLLAACSTPPRGERPSDELPPAPRTESAPPVSDDGYGLEDEGEIPEAPGDVAFEEDELPPRPEDVQSEPLDTRTPVEARDAPEELPDPDADTRIAPTITTPVPPAVESPVAGGSDAEIVRGFRVQLFAVAELPRAKTMARDAEQRLDVPVHVVSEPPYYKVRAGDFTDRADAVLLKERATSLGFDGCWVVTDQVELRKSPGTP